MGCQLGCKFCATGTLGFKRNLTAGEIFEQVVRAQKAAEAQGQPLSNIVFMGMGEPLLNYEHVLKAIERITAQDGLAMSPYRITVSTAGIPEKIKQLADDGVRFNLALSLHAAKETTRTFLMPVNKAYPLSEIAGSLKYFVEKTGTRPTFEYLLLKDVNDSHQNSDNLSDTVISSTSTATDTATSITLIIEDTGIGIREEDLPRIFEKGYTGVNGRENNRATGIGLYLSQKIMNRLGHHIYITSEEGTGTKVFLEFSRKDLMMY